MTAKEYLLQLSKLDSLIDHESAEYTALMVRAEGNSSPELKERVQTSVSGDSMDSVLDAVEVKDKIRALQLRYIRQRRIIVDQIHSLDNPLYSNILYHRYVQGKNFEQIAVAICHTYKYTINLHGHALQAFQKKFL